MIKKLFIYFISGLIFGIYNEFYFQEMWQYSDKLKPFIWKDVPLIAPFGWGLFTMSILYLSDCYCKCFKLDNVKSFYDVFVFVIIMGPLEFVLSRLGLWTYVSELHKNPITMIIGYILASALISSLARNLTKGLK